ncbi:hypothetical protein [Arvimicrobium flavum]|uniref:glycine-rich domain-containing protein n=1 Tax=Arvimicrobium flavum TaxID=3393320 RepID=UPI00237B1A24|nr:hypothetical protein [Mesorhizobium shangrilense]
MSRYPNLVGGNAPFSARNNGFFRRRLFTVPGTYSFLLPADLPTDHRGLVRVKGFNIGAGSGGSDANDASGINGSGTGGGYSDKELWVPPASAVSIVVGAPGPSSNASPSNRAGGTTTITVNGVTWQATGGQNSEGGVGSGGDINTRGGGRITWPNNEAKLSGASAGSPWGDGEAGGTPVAGKLWRMPRFWDLEDFEAGDLFAEINGIGGGAHSVNGNPTFGGGGKGGWQNSGPGAGGFAGFYY